MGKVTIELNEDGVRELMQSQDMMNICMEHANRALRSLGDGYKVTSFVGKTRVNAEITAETFIARRDNLQNNSILKALGGG